MQPKNEWLDEIRACSMRYHSIQDVQIDVDPVESGTVLTTRTLTDATIWGSRHTWRLRLRIELRADDAGELIAQCTVASTW